MGSQVASLELGCWPSKSLSISLTAIYNKDGPQYL